MKEIWKAFADSVKAKWEASKQAVKALFLDCTAQLKNLLVDIITMLENFVLDFCKAIWVPVTSLITGVIGDLGVAIYKSIIWCFEWLISKIK